MHAKNHVLAFGLISVKFSESCVAISTDLFGWL
jgi:hypothetical protein